MRCLLNRIVKPGKMRPKAGGRRRKIWKAAKGVWKTCNPLKSHKIAKDLFGKAWSKTREFWRNLEKGLEGALIPPPLAPATSGLRSSWIVIAKSEVAKQPGVAFIRKRRSNEAVRPARPEAGPELAMTGWKLARLFLGVASIRARLRPLFQGN